MSADCDNEILRIEDVAQELGIPLATLRYYRQTHRGPKFWRLMGRIVIYRRDLDAWLQEQYEAASPKVG